MSSPIGDLRRDIARDRDAVFVPFPVEQMSPSNWADAMHLDPEGSRKKAEHVAKCIRSSIIASMSTEPLRNPYPGREARSLEGSGLPRLNTRKLRVQRGE
jgi:hypothetical protein